MFECLWRLLHSVIGLSLERHTYVFASHVDDDYFVWKAHRQTHRLAVCVHLLLMDPLVAFATLHNVNRDYI